MTITTYKERTWVNLYLLEELGIVTNVPAFMRTIHFNDKLYVHYECDIILINTITDIIAGDYTSKKKMAVSFYDLDEVSEYDQQYFFKHEILLLVACDSIQLLKVKKGQQ